MDTLSIFCLGTSHEEDEKWSLMRALYDLTNAESVTVKRLTERSQSIREHVHTKVIFNGPDVFFSSNKTLDTNSRLAVDFIEHYKPGSVSLFGHSRGAVLATMIAARTYLPPTGNSTKRFNLWLLDIVAHTHVLGGLPVVPASEGLTAYPNVKNIVRVVMEDEWNPPFVFPLEDFRISDGKVRPTIVSDHTAKQGGDDRIEFIRMPGAHGNGTQVNQVAKNGDELREGTIAAVSAGSLWPMGEVCLTHALDALDQWGVPLYDFAARFRGRDRLLDAYARIRTLNRRRVDGAILLNDVGESRASTAKNRVRQTSAFHTGERSTANLTLYGTDYQFNEFIVNDQHYAALVAEFGNDLVEQLARMGSTRARPPDEPDEEFEEPEPEEPEPEEPEPEEPEPEEPEPEEPEPEEPEPEEPDDGTSWMDDLLTTLEDADQTTTEVTTTVRIGGVSFDASFAVGPRQFVVRKTNDTDDWPIGAMLADLGLDGIGVGSLNVADMVVSGSLRTGAVNVSVTFALDPPLTIGPLELRYVGMDVGTLGGVDGAYAAISASAAIGAYAADVRGEFAIGGGWKVAATLERSDETAVNGLFIELGWPAVNFGLPEGGDPTPPRIERIMLSHESATASSAIAINVDIDTPLAIGDLLTRLANDFGGQTVATPAFLDRTTLTDIDVTFSKIGADVELDVQCKGRLGFDLDSPNDIVDRDDTPAIALTVSLRKTNGAVEAGFEGTLTIGGDDPVDLGLVVERVTSPSGPATSTVVAYYQAADGQPEDAIVRGGRPLDLAGLAPESLGLPSIEVYLERLMLVWRRVGTESRYLMALAIASAEAVQADVPVIGPLFPEPGLSFGCTVIAASKAFGGEDDAVDDMTSVNEILARVGLDALPVSGAPKGVHLTGRLDVGPNALAVDTAGDDEPASPPPTDPGAQPPIPASATDDDMKWVPVQRGFGPVHIARAGLGYADGEVSLGVDASVALAGLTLSLDGLVVRTPLQRLAPEVDLSGLGVTYSSPAVTVSGSFTRRAPELSDGVLIQSETFSGGALIKTKTFSLVAIGAYERVGDETSLFVFAALNRALGGPAAFYVTGLALGFGYNRDFIPPAIEAVADHAFLAALTDDDPPTAAEMLADLGSSVPARVGSYWLAAGVKFESFGIINSKAVALVRLGNDIEILLLGLSELTLPRGAQRPFVNVELALRVSVKPDAGIAIAEARLTDNSYVIDPACRITGGFAFALWFGNHPNSGDFVVSVGGYHPRFRRPDHYPAVPRLGLSWINGPITIKGEAYFALTPSSIMAGGQLEATFAGGALTASFLLRAHFLINWKPFGYDITIGIAIRVSLAVETAFGKLVIGTSLSAEVRVWGPEFAGTGRVTWSVISFDVEFGAFRRGPSSPPDLDWDEFASSFLPPADSVCTLQIASGLLREVKMQHGGEEIVHWVVSADQVEFSTRSAIPATEVRLVDGDGAEHKVGDGRLGDASLGAQPMKNGAFTSVLRVGVHEVVNTGTRGDDRDIVRHWTHTGSIRQGVPKQLWNHESFDPTPAAVVLPDRIVGLAGLRPNVRLSQGNPPAVPMSLFDFRRVRPDKVLPLTAGSAPEAAAGPILAVGVTVFDRINATVASETVAARREEMIARARAMGFLTDDVATPVSQAALEAGAEHILASAPMLGTDVIGGPNTATAIEAPLERPLEVNLSVPARFVTLVVELLAEVSTRAYVERDAISDEQTSSTVTVPTGPRHLVVADDPRDDADVTPLQRTLEAGAGMVFDLDLQGAESVADNAAAIAALPGAQLDLGDDTALTARVVMLDRYGDVISDGPRQGVVDLDPTVARGVVVIGPPTNNSAAEHASGWHWTSSMLRIAPRTFVVDGGVVVVQADDARGSGRVEAVRGGSVVRSNTTIDRSADSADGAGAASRRPGWVRTRLANRAESNNRFAAIETLAVIVRRLDAGGDDGSSIRVEVGAADGTRVRLVPLHVIHHSDTDVALLFRVPAGIREEAGSTTDSRVQVPANGRWSLGGVLGFFDRPHTVRRNWTPGATGLRAPIADPSATRTVTLAKRVAA